MNFKDFSHKKILNVYKVVFFSIFLFFSSYNFSNDIINLTVRTKDGIILFKSSKEVIEDLKKILFDEGKGLSNLEIISKLGKYELVEKLDFQFYRDTTIEAEKVPGIVIKSTVSSAVNLGYLPNIINMSLEEVFFLFYAEGWDFGIFGHKPDRKISVPKNIFLYSAPKYFNESKIWIDGRDYSLNDIGYNFVVLNSKGEIVEVRSFKTPVSIEESEKMVKFLEGFKGDNYYILSSLKWGATNYFSSNASKYLKKLGKKYIPDTRTHFSDVFIFNGDELIENFKLDYPSTLAIFKKDSYFESEDEITSLITPGIIIISGTKPEDLVYICGKIE